jgi:hypothetical protein
LRLSARSADFGAMPSSILRRRPDSDLPESRLVGSERDRGMRSLVRVNPDHHDSHDVLLKGMDRGGHV